MSLAVASVACDISGNGPPTSACSVVVSPTAWATPLYIVSASGSNVPVPTVYTIFLILPNCSSLRVSISIIVPVAVGVVGSFCIVLPAVNVPPVSGSVYKICLPLNTKSSFWPTVPTVVSRSCFTVANALALSST